MGVEPEIYRDYQDHEWGLLTTDVHRLFEKTCLEGFQGRPPNSPYGSAHMVPPSQSRRVGTGSSQVVGAQPGRDGKKAVA